MDRAARRYARWVLIIHLALFAAVLLVIGLTARVLYRGAYDQAISQASLTQEMLARQTGLSIKNYYDSITGVLELLQPPLVEPATRAQPRAGAALDAAALSRLAPSIWQSLAERVSLLFLVDARDPRGATRTLGTNDGAVAPAPADVQQHLGPWLADVRRASVSPFIPFDRGGGAHVIVVPLRGTSTLTLVAVVPIAKLEQALLRDVNSRATVGAMLSDENGVIISHSRPELIGKNVLTDLADPRTRQLAERYMKTNAAGTEVFRKAEVIAGVQMRPAMATVQPLEVLGKHWALVIASDLGEVDRFVMPVFRDAMLWGAFIMLGLTAILSSTAIQTIRSRVRLERVRHEMINKELAQARAIQLAWLPNNDDDPPHVDLSAINQPATQISGDFYNWFQLCDGRTVVVIGDVTGHGMAAAFLMATTQLLIRTTMPRCMNPGECLNEANRQLCIQAFNGQFVTMLVLVIDVHSGTVDLATAGHPAPLVGQGEHFELLPVQPELVLGVDPDQTYTTQRFTLARGSALVLYTDGVIDAQNERGERFSVEGLARSLYGRYEHAQAIIDAIVRAVDGFRGEQPIPDDLTLVAVQLQAAAVPHREPPAVVNAT
jgi:serine phosphatase RsbU (regulator of sigma subunit)